MDETQEYEKIYRIWETTKQGGEVVKYPHFIKFHEETIVISYNRI